MTDHVTLAGVDPRQRTADRELRQRAAAVIPGGMYGHQSAGPLPPEYPQFMRTGRGARVWDADGNCYVDLMCSYGPLLLGHQHPKVEQAARAQAAQADCQNGTDATTMCCTIARA
jgi:glutamate-1-semialdehyde 2,1-aminomutase